MDKGTLIVSTVELLVFLLPTIKIFISLGEYKSKIKNLEDTIMSMSDVNERLTKLECKIDYIVETIKEQKK